MVRPQQRDLSNIEDNLETCKRTKKGYSQLTTMNIIHYMLKSTNDEEIMEVFVVLKIASGDIKSDPEGVEETLIDKL